jgi:hypothetical protein
MAGNQQAEQGRAGAVAPDVETPVPADTGAAELPPASEGLDLSGVALPGRHRTAKPQPERG